MWIVLCLHFIIAAPRQWRAYVVLIHLNFVGFAIRDKTSDRFYGICFAIRRSTEAPAHLICIVKKKEVPLDSIESNKMLNIGNFFFLRSFFYSESYNVM